LSHTYKISSNILLSRLIPYAEEINGNHQCGFQRSRSNTDHIFCICQILENRWKYNEAVHQLFIDFKKAYDSVSREVLYNILVEFVIPMNLVRLIKMCLNAAYSRVRLGNKYLSEVFPIRNGLKQHDVLSPFFFNFSLEYAIKRVQVNQDGFKLNGSHKLFYADDVDKLGGNVHTVNKTQKLILVGSKEIGLEVNTGKPKYMVMSRDQNSGRSHIIKIENNSFGNLEEFKYLGKNLTNQNSIQEENKNRFKSVNACYHSVQNLLSSSLLFKNLKIKIHRTIILPVFIWV